MHCPIHNIEHTRNADLFFLTHRGVCEDVYHERAQASYDRVWTSPQPMQKRAVTFCACGRPLSSFYAKRCRACFGLARRKLSTLTPTPP